MVTCAQPVDPVYLLTACRRSSTSCRSWRPEPELVGVSRVARVVVHPERQSDGGVAARREGRGVVITGLAAAGGGIGVEVGPVRPAVREMRRVAAAESRSPSRRRCPETCVEVQPVELSKPLVKSVVVPPEAVEVKLTPSCWRWRSHGGARGAEGVAAEARRHRVAAVRQAAERVGAAVAVVVLPVDVPVRLMVTPEVTAPETVPEML